MSKINELGFSPKLREDLSIKVSEEDNNKFVIISDPIGYAGNPVVLPIEIIPFLQMLDGTMSIDTIINTLQGYGISDEYLVPYLNLIDYLEISYYLESKSYFDLKQEIDEYLLSPVRHTVCSGYSYPEDPVMLQRMFDAMMTLADGKSDEGNAKAIIAPHIDFRIGRDALKSYASAYKSIHNSDADIFVIFGTAHHRNTGNFMMTEKDFNTPFGIVETDREIIASMRSINSQSVNIDDLAHRLEHSIEFQVVLLKYMFPLRHFTILPVLTGSHQYFMMRNTNPSEDTEFNLFLGTLSSAILRSKKKAVYIASGDLSHIGRKFNDEFDASEKINELSFEDKALIAHLENCDAEAFYDNIARINDKWKVCGLPPFYALLKAAAPTKGKFLEYSIWSEEETNSAVSFTSLFYL